MATSGSTNYAENTRTIIEDALIGIGKLAPGESVETEVFNYCKRRLNRMVKAWEAFGYNLFRATEGEITLVADQQSYSMGGSGAPDFSVKPLRIESMRFVQSDGTEAPSMIQLSREDYFTLPNKDAQGTSTTFYYDPQRASGTLYIWPVLSAVDGEKIKFTYQRAFEDFDTNTDEPDFPQEWFDALVETLGFKLCKTFFPGKPEIHAAHKADAMEALSLVTGFDRENADIRLMLGEE